MMSGGEPHSAGLHPSGDLGELWRRLCHNDSAINVVLDVSVMMP